MTSMTDRVRQAIETTEEHLSDYWKGVLAQRAELSGQAAGSVYEGLTPVGLALKIFSAEWQPYEHPAIMTGCTAAKAEIPGRLGLVRLADLYSETEVHLLDPKRTGKVSATVHGVRGQVVDFSVLIMGTEKVGDNELEVVFTFHPGEPVRPSVVESVEHAGKVVTPAQAIALGFDLAKVE